MADLVLRCLFGMYSTANLFAAGAEGLRALTSPKVVTVDRWPLLINTRVPRVLDYPIASLVQSWYDFKPFLLKSDVDVSCRDFISGLVALLYADAWHERMHGLVRLARAST